MPLWFTQGKLREKSYNLNLLSTKFAHIRPLKSFRWANIKEASICVNEKLANNILSSRTIDAILPQAEIDPAILRFLLLIRCNGLRLHDEDAVRRDRAVLQEQ